MRQVHMQLRKFRINCLILRVDPDLCLSRVGILNMYYTHEIVICFLSFHFPKKLNDTVFLTKSTSVDKEFCLGFRNGFFLD